MPEQSNTMDTAEVEKTELFKKMWGCLAIGAIGDRLGRPVEGWHYQRIDEEYGRLTDPWSGLEGGVTALPRILRRLLNHPQPRVVLDANAQALPATTRNDDAVAGIDQFPIASAWRRPLPEIDAASGVRPESNTGYPDSCPRPDWGPVVRHVLKVAHAAAARVCPHRLRAFEDRAQVLVQ